VKSQRERDAEKREQKLKDIDEAVEGGRLVIRKMTKDERKRFPAKEPPPKGTRR
jgi:hypothetical protein